MSLGSAMLRVGGSNLLDFISLSPTAIPSFSSVNKIGLAAEAGNSNLSPEEILHRKEVALFD